MTAAAHRTLALYPIFAVAVTMVSLIAIKTARDSVFFSGDGLGQLPLVYMAVAFVSIPAAMMHLESIRRFGARRMRVAIYVAAALMFAGFAPFIGAGHPIAVWLLFALVPPTFAALFAAAWLLAADLLEGVDEQSIAWAYSRIGVGSLVGGMVGGILARGLAELLAPPFLVGAGAIGLLAAAEIIRRGHGRRPFRPGAPRPDPGPKAASPVTAGALELMGNRYVVALIAISGLAAVAALCIEFQFYALASRSGNVGMDFFATFYAVLNAAALLLLLAAGPWIQTRLGLGGALLVLPAALLGGAGFVLFNATVLSRALLKVTEGGLKSSIHRVMWEQVFLPLAGRGRDLAKVLVDGLFPRICEGLTAAGLYLWMVGASSAEINLSRLAWITALVIAAWLTLTKLSGVGRAVPCSTFEARTRIPDS